MFKCLRAASQVVITRATWSYIRRSWSYTKGTFTPFIISYQQLVSALKIWGKMLLTFKPPKSKTPWENPPKFQCFVVTLVMVSCISSLNFQLSWLINVNCISVMQQVGSSFSTNMAIPEKNDQGWSAISTQWMKAMNEWMKMRGF